MTASSTSTIPCSLCRTPIDPQTALYGDNGRVCEACGSRSDMADRIIRSCRGLAFSALGTAAVSWFLNPLLLVTLGAFSTAIVAVKPYFSDDPDEREALRNHPLAMVVGILAMVLAGIPVLLRFVVL